MSEWSVGDLAYVQHDPKKRDFWSWKSAEKTDTHMVWRRDQTGKFDTLTPEKDYTEAIVTGDGISLTTATQKVKADHTPESAPGMRVARVREVEPRTPGVSTID